MDLEFKAKMAEALLYDMSAAKSCGGTGENYGQYHYHQG